MARAVIAIVVFAGFLMVNAAAGAAPQEQIHNFYGKHPEVRTQTELVHMLGTELKFSQEQFVELFNAQFGSRIGRVESFGQLMQLLESADFKVQLCSGTVVNFGFTDPGAFVATTRSCHENEWELVHVPSGTRVISLWCGNLYQPPPIHVPPRQQISECMEIVVHIVDQSGRPSSGTPHLLLWSGDVTQECGVRVIPCDCYDKVLGPVGGAFDTHLVNGYGTILVPRRWFAADTFQQLCVVVGGYVTRDGVHHAGTIRLVLAKEVRTRAREGSTAVLPDTAPGFEFHRSPDG
jgi:hypothetical protein